MFGLPPPHPGRRSISSGPCRRQHEQRDVPDPVDELVDEIQHCVVGPVEVLEHEHQRPLLGERLEKAPPGRERFPRSRRAGSRSNRAVVAGAPRATRLRGVRGEIGDGAPQLRGRLVAEVALEDVRLGFHDLAEGPEVIPSPYGSDRP